MTDKPIPFSGPMVRAILEGRKTQTRRVVPFEMISGANPDFTGWRPERVGARDWQLIGGYSIGATFRAPYAPGDRLWVRESIVRDETDQGVGYQTYAACGSKVCPLTKWFHRRESIPSIHMPRWASRLTLTVTDVRVQRLREISEADAKAEGAYMSYSPGPLGWTFDGIGSRFLAKDSFRTLWDSLNAKPKPVGGKVTTHYVSYPWDDERRTETHRGKPHLIHPNPWVCAVTFTAHNCNIDQMERRQ